VSFTHDSFLSAHITQAGGGDEPTLLGGHRLNVDSLPFSASDLVVGAFGASRFRGQIGPFGVLSKKKLRQELSGHLSAMSHEPNRIPREIDSEIVELWASPAIDLGPKKYEVISMEKSDREMGVPEGAKQKNKALAKNAARVKKKAGMNSAAGVGALKGQTQRPQTQRPQIHAVQAKAQTKQ
jgi:hypothetical protein